MKNIPFIFCLSLGAFALHGSEVALNNGSNIDAKKIIKDDFKKYLGNRLKGYSKVALTRDDRQDIENMYTRITNDKKLSFLSKCIHREVFDEHGNTFVHKAVFHKDLAVIEWAMKYLKHPISTPNKDDKEPIDLCIDYLMPTAESADKKEETKIFEALVVAYGKAGFDDERRLTFLKKIVALEFAHIKQGSHLALKEDNIIKNFSATQSELSKIYQEIRDEKGNTFTHILVSRHLADMLYKFIEKGYITFAKDKHQEDPLLLAEKMLSEVAKRLLQTCAPNKEFYIGGISKEDKEKKCCYHMLQNYLKKQDRVDFKKCCDKHLI